MAYATGIVAQGTRCLACGRTPGEFHRYWCSEGKHLFLTRDEVAEIERTFQFDEDGKSVTIMRLVADVRVLRDALVEAGIDLYVARSDTTKEP
jgi:hypothetical protein